MDCKWTCASTKWTVSKATEMWKVEWWCVGIGCVMIERADGVASDLIVGVAVNWEESGRSWRVIAASKSERSRETLFVSHSNGDNNTLKKKKNQINEKREKICHSTVSVFGCDQFVSVNYRLIEKREMEMERTMTCQSASMKSSSGGGVVINGLNICSRWPKNKQMMRPPFHYANEGHLLTAVDWLKPSTWCRWNANAFLIFSRVDLVKLCVRWASRFNGDTPYNRLWMALNRSFDAVAVNGRRPRGAPSATEVLITCKWDAKATGAGRDMCGVVGVPCQ